MTGPKTESITLTDSLEDLREKLEESMVYRRIAVMSYEGELDVFLPSYINILPVKLGLSREVIWFGNPR